MATREAHTLDDVKDLCMDCNAIPEAVNDQVFMHFPTDDDEIDEIARNQKYCEQYHTHTPINDRAGVGMTRRTVQVIRCLVGNPRFWRMTTFADHITHFSHQPEGKKCGIIKLRKKAGELFTITFSTPKQAKRFVDQVMSVA